MSRLSLQMFNKLENITLKWLTLHKRSFPQHLLSEGGTGGPSSSGCIHWDVPWFEDPLDKLINKHNSMAQNLHKVHNTFWFSRKHFKAGTVVLSLAYAGSAPLALLLRLSRNLTTQAIKIKWWTYRALRYLSIISCNISALDLKSWTAHQQPAKLSVVIETSSQ